MVSVKIIILFILGFNTSSGVSQDKDEEVAYILTRKLNGHIELETLEVISTPPAYLETNDNEKGSDKRIEDSYLDDAEATTINETVLAAPVDVQGGLLSEQLTDVGDTRTSGNSVEKNESLIVDTPETLGRENELVFENLLTEKPLEEFTKIGTEISIAQEATDERVPKILIENEFSINDFGNDLHNTLNSEADIEDLNSFIKLDPYLQEAIEKTTRSDLGGDPEDVASILSDESITEDYEMTKDFETDNKLKEVIDILWKDKSSSIDATERYTDTGNYNGKLNSSDTSTTTTESVEVSTFENLEEHVDLTQKIIIDFTNVTEEITTEFIPEEFEKDNEDLFDISKDLDENKPSGDITKLMKSGSDTGISTKESNERTKMFVVGRNDYDISSSEVENMYNKILESNNYEDSEEHIEFDHSKESILTTEKITENQYNIHPQFIVGRILENVANFSISISRKGGTQFFVPRNSYIKRIGNEISISWKSQENALNSSLLLKTLETEKYYYISDIGLALPRGKRLVVTRRSVLIEPFGENLEIHLNMNDGTKISFSNVNFLKKTFQDLMGSEAEDIWENQIRQERIWRIEILTISISLTVIFASLFYFVIHKIKRRAQLQQKSEVQVTRCSKL